MEKKDFYVQPKIADKIVELCQEHNLPVNIIIGVLGIGGWNEACYIRV